MSVSEEIFHRIDERQKILNSISSYLLKNRIRTNFIAINRDIPKLIDIGVDSRYKIDTTEFRENK